MTCSKYIFVIDMLGNKLAPTKENKAYYLLRKGRAKIINKYPMVIQLLKVVETPISNITLGIDDGAKHVGVALVQHTEKEDKSIFKGTIELRQNVSKLMEQRKFYRQNRRRNKRYREKRFSNRSSSKRKERLSPTIKQKKDSVLRIVDRMTNFININNIILEDVKFDIRALTDGYKPYKYNYSKSNRLDENIRTATFIRDNGKCQMCGLNHSLEAHHITPRRYNGNDSINNLITLCNKCHKSITNKELEYKEYFYNKINGKNINIKDPMHVMQGKKYLQKELSTRANLSLTTGADTANRRKDNNIHKSHSNDALCVASNIIDNVVIDDWVIKPLRTKKKGDYKKKTSNGLKLGDYVEYKPKSGIIYNGYISSITKRKDYINLITLDKVFKKISSNSCRLLYHPNKQLWMI